MDIRSSTASDEERITRDSIGYLGPAGSWTHQASLDLFGPRRLVPLENAKLFEAFANGTIERACVPVTTSVVGTTPYLDPVLDLPSVVVVAEYPKMLGYSLLACPGAKIEDIRQVVAHPVALEEVKPWLDREMPSVRRTTALGGGAAAQSVSESKSLEMASMGPKIGGSIYGLVSLADDIEAGPHNVTRWWVLGREMPLPTGVDKTSLLAEVSDKDFSALLESMVWARLRILNIYERPSKRTLDTHRYLFEIEGHARVGAVAEFLKDNLQIRLLGSYPRMC
ncbi:prephenate dehydratase [Paraburkholderia ginsengiterrae]|uniref:prephenate dehydratase n=1 Tax=Paraburkholderia ginsengiterrae TaxID=1462993 RepID=A0A1A9NBD0_9BURK|nr:prephenate dehydratase domain-containing protein [Paraburkholderia ginsengiterrae]OAJ59364.1 prephenate dehydratase [Paraburkholderia ginsengiterrae]OAJ63277.1 prephenate dehydratase [Paraburkholderia ginsengiterrae]